MNKPLIKRCFSKNIKSSVGEAIFAGLDLSSPVIENHKDSQRRINNVLQELADQPIPPFARDAEHAIDKLSERLEKCRDMQQMLVLLARGKHLFSYEPFAKKDNKFPHNSQEILDMFLDGFTKKLCELEPGFNEAFQAKQSRTRSRAMKEAQKATKSTGKDRHR